MHCFKLFHGHITLTSLTRYFSISQVFKTEEKLTEFASLRVRYLLYILKETLGMRDPHPRLALSESMTECLLQICEVSPNKWHLSDTFQTMVVYDSMQFAKFWAADWAALLGGSESYDAFCEALQKKVGKTGLADAAGNATDASKNGGGSSAQASVADMARLSWQSFKKVVEVAREGAAEGDKDTAQGRMGRVAGSKTSF